MGSDVFVSHQIGDLETSEAETAFRHASTDLPRLYNAKPEIVACDLYPDYLSSRDATHLATKLNARLHPVQHHWAHVLSCLTENDVQLPALGVVWDGAGHGPDGTIWGGEFLLATEKSYERVAHFRQFRLPGGDAAMRQPCRMALGVLYDTLGPKVLTQQAHLAPLREFSESDLTQIKEALGKGSTAPLTSSVGRLFDAVASISGVRQTTSFEGQAAMDLEFAIQSCVCEAYSFEIKSTAPSVVDWRPMIEEIIDDVRNNTSVGIIASKFHNAMVEIIVSVARHVGQTRVALTGACFQNRYLTERAVQRLLEEGFRPYWHQRMPTNDGGIALGQIMDAARSRAAAATPPLPLKSKAKALV
jgi:hydrogenase maturation protein HypF